MTATDRFLDVTSLDEPRLGPYRNVRDRDLANSEVFLAESEVVLRVLIERATHPLRSVLLSRPRAEKLASLLAHVPAEVPIFVAEQPVIDAIAGFHLHRGVMACAARTPLADSAALLAALPPGPATVVVLEGLTNHDNVGAIFRNAAALGAAGILLDAATCDPLYRKAIRVSVGACLVVPYARDTRVADTIVSLKTHGFHVMALTPNEPARDIEEFRRERPDRIALLLGSEGPGLENATLALADDRVRIRQRAGFDSLNVATACGVALHELGQR